MSFTVAIGCKPCDDCSDVCADFFFVNSKFKYKQSLYRRRSCQVYKSFRRTAWAVTVTILKNVLHNVLHYCQLSAESHSKIEELEDPQQLKNEAIFLNSDRF